MELVTPECYHGLSEEEKQAQLYLAFYTWADDTDLLDPECFLGYPHRDEAIYAALHTQGGTVDPSCIESLPPEERQLAMYEAVYSAAADDTLTHPDCFLSLAPEVRDLAFYTALYVIAGDLELLSPECFLGSSREEQRAAIYAAAYQIAQEPVDPIVALEPLIWYRKDRISTPSGDPVGIWMDASETPNNATQASGSSQPLMTDEGPEFDGVDDFMQSSPVTVNDFTICAVVSLREGGSFPVVVALDTSTHLRFFLNTGRVQFLYRSASAITSTDAVPLLTKALLCARRVVATGDAELLVNGVSAGTASGAPTPISSPVFLGSDVGSGFFMSGTISEVVIFPKWLSDEELSVASASIKSRNGMESTYLSPESDPYRTQEGELYLQP